MRILLNGVEKYKWPVSTGRPSYFTPSGSYTGTSMNEVWYSKEWDDAPMPHSIFFTKDGHAIHGSYEVKKLGKPVSHGCVRISPKNAATLYSLVAKNGIKNTQVVLTGFTPGGEGKVASSARSRSAKAATSARLKSRYVRVTPRTFRLRDSPGEAPWPFRSAVWRSLLQWTGLPPTATGLLPATRILRDSAPEFVGQFLTCLSQAEISSNHCRRTSRLTHVKTRGGTPANGTDLLHQGLEHRPPSDGVALAEDGPHSSCTRIEALVSQSCFFPTPPCFESPAKKAVA